MKLKELIQGRRDRALAQAPVPTSFTQSMSPRSPVPGAAPGPAIGGTPDRVTDRTKSPAEIEASRGTNPSVMNMPGLVSGAVPGALGPATRLFGYPQQPPSTLPPGGDPARAGATAGALGPLSLGMKAIDRIGSYFTPAKQPTQGPTVPAQPTPSTIDEPIT